MAYSIRQNPAHPNNYDSNRKTIDMIIIHHAATTNFDTIGQVFKNPANGVSAHYGVGQKNNVDQYVSENRVAYHAGNYPVNQRSIGIENVNSTGAPNWDVAISTKNTLVELCTNIVRRNPHIGKLVVGKNLLGHKDVSQLGTACPMQLESFLQELARRVNAAIAGTKPAPQPPVKNKKSNTAIAREVLAGKWGNGPDRVNRLKKAGYNPATIQKIVNDLVNIKAKAPTRKSNTTIAREVIAGKWGNGPTRRLRLKRAGYDYNAVQAIINKLI